MIKTTLKDACKLLDAAWYVSTLDGKAKNFCHNSYGYSGDPDEDFFVLTMPQHPCGEMRFIEKDNTMVVIDGALMRLVNEAGATVDLVLFMQPSHLEGLRVV